MWLLMTNLPVPEGVELQQPEEALARLYHLVLLDDDDHSYHYVIEMLGRILGYESEKAYALACIVDSEGRVTIETGDHERLTRHQEQIHAYGPDPRIPHCKGSMSAVVEDLR